MAPGKTTTLKTLCGVIPAMQGKVEFEGHDLTNRNPYDIVDAGITMIPEGRQLFPHFTVRDNLLMGSYKRAARPIVQRKLDEVLRIFPRVKERLPQYAGSFCWYSTNPRWACRRCWCSRCSTSSATSPRTA
ncbi:hypothetical protein G6F57_021673 [Rhizopus arrhizus]|nr:hypothetical protein G6F57_021673 [Rhizopus arrhizus]